MALLQTLYKFVVLSTFTTSYYIQTKLLPNNIPLYDGDVPVSVLLATSSLIPTILVIGYLFPTNPTDTCSLSSLSNINKLACDPERINII